MSNDNDTRASVASGGAPIAVIRQHRIAADAALRLSKGACGARAIFLPVQRGSRDGRQGTLPTVITALARKDLMGKSRETALRFTF